MQTLLAGCPFGSPLVALEDVDSTNLEICRMRQRGAPEGALAVAESQNCGRGRRGRTWVSPPGENLYFSLLACPRLPAARAPLVTLVMGLAVAEALESMGFLPGLKWPNDVVLRGKKACGILTEWHADGDGYFLVVGTGINVNQTSFPEGLEGKATSMVLERLSQREGFFQREPVLALVLRRFSDFYETLEQDGDLSRLRGRYEKYLVNTGRAVEVLDPKGSWKGVAEGISDGGELIVRDGSGGVRLVYAGEVSVRGVYGYV